MEDSPVVPLWLAACSGQVLLVLVLLLLQLPLRVRRGPRARLAQRGAGTMRAPT